MAIDLKNNSKSNIELFNPEISPIFRNTVAVCPIFDKDGKYIGDLFFSDGGSRATPFKEAWKSLTAGETMRVERRLRAGYVPGTRFIKGAELPPGEYTLQVIFLDRLLSPCPFDGTELRLDFVKAAAWQSLFMEGEAFRSNALKFQIVE
jgi:hypothetical protein